MGSSLALARHRSPPPLARLARSRQPRSPPARPLPHAASSARSDPHFTALGARLHTRSRPAVASQRSLTQDAACCARSAPSSSRSLPLRSAFSSRASSPTSNPPRASSPTRDTSPRTTRPSFWYSKNSPDYGQGFGWLLAAEALPPDASTPSRLEALLSIPAGEDTQRILEGIAQSASSAALLRALLRLAAESPFLPTARRFLAWSVANCAAPLAQLLPAAAPLAASRVVEALAAQRAGLQTPLAPAALAALQTDVPRLFDGLLRLLQACPRDQARALLRSLTPAAPALQPVGQLAEQVDCPETLLQTLADRFDTIPAEAEMLLRVAFRCSPSPRELLFAALPLTLPPRELSQEWLAQHPFFALLSSRLREVAFQECMNSADILESQEKERIMEWSLLELLHEAEIPDAVLAFYAEVVQNSFTSIPLDAQNITKIVDRLLLKAPSESQVVLAMKILGVVQLTPQTAQPALLAVMLVGAERT